MVIRGFVGPEKHRLYLMQTQKSNIFSNILAVSMLLGLSVVITFME